MTPAYFHEQYWETYLQIRNKSIIFYDLPANPKGHTRAKLLSPTYSGTTTDHAKKRISKAIDLMLQLYPPRIIYNPVIEKNVRHQLSFITLTISAKERHLEAHEGYKLCLAPWILRMRRKAGLKTYIWKAEFQKNGQLHYHITTPSFIPYSIIRDEWNNILRKAGLLSQYQYYTEKGPNSTDVHSVYKVKNIQAYLTKYISKGNKDVLRYWKKFQVTCTNQKTNTPHKEQQIISALRAQIIADVKQLPIYKITKGKIWDCSQNLKFNKLFSILAPSNFEINVSGLEHITLDRCTLYKTKKPTEILPQSIQKEYVKWLTEIRKEEN